MNFIIQIGGNRTWTIFQETAADTKTSIDNQDVLFRANGYNGWKEFWAALQTALNQHPEAKIFVAGSAWGQYPYIEGVFKILWNNAQNRNEGFCLQRKEKGVWVNVTNDSSNARGVLEQLNLIFNNGTDSHKIAVSNMQIQFEPNHWISV